MTFHRNTWFLIKELVPLFLLGDNYDDRENDIESKILNINNKDCAGSKIGSGSWKPIVSDVVIGKCFKVSKYVDR